MTPEVSLQLHCVTKRVQDRSRDRGCGIGNSADLPVLRPGSDGLVCSTEYWKTGGWPGSQKPRLQLGNFLVPVTM